MDYVGGLSSIVSIVSFVIFAAGVMKLFQMATTLSEIKDVLTSIKLTAAIQPAVGATATLPSAQSGEDMLRAALSGAGSSGESHFDRTRHTQS